jgi:hypothetical protein
MSDVAARVDYVGAVYGSLLAASVVAGASPSTDPPSPAALMTVLLATGVVFWLAHVYARLIGDRERDTEIGWRQVRSVGTSEWPIAEAAIPPAVVAAVGWVLGLSDSTTAWAALLVAVVGQAGWGMVAAARVGAPRRIVVVSGLANVFLGLIVVALKALLAH